MARNALNWKFYRDGDRMILGPSEWQGRAKSLTYGILEIYADEGADMDRLIRRARCTPMARCNELKRPFNTYDRFEDACEAGNYGPAW